MKKRDFSYFVIRAVVVVNMTHDEGSGEWTGGGGVTWKLDVRRSYVCRPEINEATPEGLEQKKPDGWSQRC